MIEDSLQTIMKKLKIGMIKNINQSTSSILFEVSGAP
jgi:hypothetical protein